VLSGPAIKNLEGSKIEKLFISDTVIETISHPKIEIVSCASILATAIENVMQNKSLSQL
jgi:ribose-phosphate pyrophosphokinase